MSEPNSEGTFSQHSLAKTTEIETRRTQGGNNEEREAKLCHLARQITVESKVATKKYALGRCFDRSFSCIFVAQKSHTPTTLTKFRRWQTTIRARSMVTFANSADDLQNKRSKSRRPDLKLSEALQDLNQKLQTTLDLHKLLSLFYEAVHRYARVDGITYTSSDTSTVCSYGLMKPNSADYKIKTDEQDLGTICFTRQQRFAEPELVALELLLGSLFYPLRNALLYQQAVLSSMRDPLTNVGNRMALAQAMTREVEMAKRYHRPFSVLLIDVDHFKQVNDTIGHAAGDQVLQHLASKITNSLRQIDEVFRYGGEEFVVLLNNTDHKAPVLVAERIRQALEAEPVDLEGELLTVTVSIGLSVYKHHDSEESLFERADQALYEAKNSGRNQVVHSDALKANG
jgi:diguanylate cyclase (GGDEF)-like protein